MNGLIKALLGVVGLILVLVAVAFVVVTMRLDGWVKAGVETYGSEYAGVAVTLDGVSISPFTGRGELRGLVVANPEGYEGDAAFRLGRVAVSLRPTGVLDDPVVIEHIDIDGAEVNTVSRELRDTNLQVILRNVRAATPSADPEAAPGPQVIIDRLDFTGARASVTAAPLGAVSVRVPDLQLTDIGRRSGGASVGEVIEQLLEPIVAAVLRSVAEGRVREALEERGEAVRGRLEEEAEDLEERLRDRLPF